MSLKSDLKRFLIQKTHLKLPKTVLKVGKPFVKRTSNFVVYRISNLADLTSLEEKFSNFVKRFNLEKCSQGYSCFSDTLVFDTNNNSS